MHIISFGVFLYILQPIIYWIALPNQVFVRLDGNPSSCFVLHVQQKIVQSIKDLVEVLGLGTRRMT